MRRRSIKLYAFNYEHISVDISDHVVGVSESDDKFFLSLWYDFN